MKIMVVDDEVLIVEGLKKIIQDILGYDLQVEVAFNGIDAMKKSDTFAPDLVITDICMPGMDGLALIQELQNKGVCNSFLILTGYSEFEYARQAIKFHVSDYILKPVNKEELVRIVKGIADKLASSKPDEQPSLPQIGVLAQAIDTDSCSPIMKKAIRYINDNYMDRIYRESIANYLDLNSNYLCVLFQKELGVTVLQYIDYIRVKKAAEMLIRQKEKTIHEISDELGYTSVNFFTKVFKKRIGVTPGNFRDQFSC